MTDKHSGAQDLVRQAATARAVAQDLRRAGWSLSRIAEHLQAEGVPAPSRWRGKPSRWNGPAVKRLLAEKPPEVETEPSSEPVSEPQPMTITATGPMLANGSPVAITVTASGIVVSASAPVTINTRVAPPSTEPVSQRSFIERVDTPTLLALARRGPHEMTVPLAGPGFLNALFPRKRA